MAAATAAPSPRDTKSKCSGSIVSSNGINSVRDFYRSKTIFITGGTGFMGKVLLEKLLRSCPDVSRIYLLIRPKKGHNAQERLYELLQSPLFNEVRRDNAKQLQKVLPIQGDITEPQLAISTMDRNVLVHTVNVVFHSAATVKFDEKLKLSVQINVEGTQALIHLCGQMVQLEALIHVSTAYCNCDRKHIYETVYHRRQEQQRNAGSWLPEEGPASGATQATPTMHVNDITTLVHSLDEHVLDSLTKHLIGDRPNTYTFTKALTEQWLYDNCAHLPLAIVRPTIVLSTWQGPMAGWVDNWNGPTGIIAAAGKGLFRTMHCDPNKIADIVPVDVVINVMIVAAYQIGQQQQMHRYTQQCNQANGGRGIVSESSISGAVSSSTATSTPLVTPTASNVVPVYNCSTGLRRPITWQQFIDMCFKYMRKHPIGGIAWYPDGTVTSSSWLNRTNQLLLHWLPAYLLDAIRLLTGQKPIMLRMQDKLGRAARCLEYFTTNEWYFHDDNVMALNAMLNESDRNEFALDVSRIDWERYIESYVLGIRQYICKEGPESIGRARAQMTRLYWLHRLLQLATVMWAWRFMAARSAHVRRVWSEALRLLFLVLKMVWPPLGL